MRRELPDFQYMDSTARRKYGRPAFYGPGKLFAFAWAPRPPLVLVIVFRVVMGRDSFEASCEWSDSGKIVKEQSPVFDDPFSNSVMQRPFARAGMQALSHPARETPEQHVAFWQFWSPTASMDDPEAFMREGIADAMRDLPDAEAKDRVETAVARAVNDVKRLAMPWFTKKLETAGRT